VCSLSDEPTDQPCGYDHLPTQNTFLSRPPSFETIQFFKNDSSIRTPGMCPWSWSVNLPYYFIISAVVCAVLHFIFGRMETNVNTHDVGLFSLFFGDQDFMIIIFLMMDINFTGVEIQYKQSFKDLHFLFVWLGSPSL
jgi:hypothetical protein